MMHSHHNFSSSNGVDYRARQLEERRRVVEFFKEKNALSASTATKVTSIDWATLGVNPKETAALLVGNQFDYIVSTGEDMYYVDEALLTARLNKEGTLNKNINGIMKPLLIGFVIFFALTILFQVIISIFAFGAFGGILGSFSGFLK